MKTEESEGRRETAAVMCQGPLGFLLVFWFFAFILKINYLISLK